VSTLDRLACLRLGKKPADIDRALRAVVRAAYSTTPVYRSLLAGSPVDVSQIRTRADLAKLPVVSKVQMLEGFPTGALRGNVDPGRCQMRFTSGSTGMPFAVFYNRLERWFRRAGLLRAIGRHTPIRWPLRIVEIGTGPNQLSQIRRPAGSSASRRLARLSPLVVVHVSRELPPAEQVERIRRAGASIVTGHPSLLELVAETLVRDPERPVRARLVICRGEVLSPRVRDMLSAAFQCPVVDFYNCEEIGNIAWECPAHPDRMHVNEDLCWLETIDEDGAVTQAGAAGRVVVTSLYNRTMPFVRYLLDDQARRMGPDDERCDCGHRGRTISLVQGRAQDFLCLPDGRRVSPRVFDSIVARAVLGGLGKTGFLEIRSAVRYQVIQETVDRFRVRLMVGGGGLSSDNLGAVRAAVEALHPEVRCEVEPVDELPLEPSGKRRAILSRVTGGDP